MSMLGNAIIVCQKKQANSILKARRYLPSKTAMKMKLFKMTSTYQSGN